MNPFVKTKSSQRKRKQEVKAKAPPSTSKQRGHPTKLSSSLSSVSASALSSSSSLSSSSLSRKKKKSSKKRSGMDYFTISLKDSMPPPPGNNDHNTSNRSKFNETRTSPKRKQSHKSPKKRTQPRLSNSPSSLKYSTLPFSSSSASASARRKNVGSKKRAFSEKIATIDSQQKVRSQIVIVNCIVAGCKFLLCFLYAVFSPLSFRASVSLIVVCINSDVHTNAHFTLSVYRL